jgi:hypothetical protein
LTDLQLAQLLINGGGIAVGLVVLTLVCRQLLGMVSKMIATQAELIDKLAEALVECNQTNSRVRELIDEMRRKSER